MDLIDVKKIQEIDKLKNALRFLYATMWRGKSIEDHKAIIREALGETEEEIFKKLEDAAAGEYKAELNDAGI